MAITQKTLIDFDRTLDKKELLFVQKKGAILQFVGGQHTASETTKAFKDLLELEAEQNALLHELLKFKAQNQFREEATRLCERCKQQENYLRDMREVLSQDFVERKGEEDRCEGKINKRSAAEKDTRFDILKEAGCYIAFPIGFVAITKNGYGHGRWTVDDAGNAGLFVSNVILFRKPLRAVLKSAFSNVAVSVCAAPKAVRNSFTLYYAKETVRQYGGAVLSEARRAIDRIHLKM